MEITAALVKELSERTGSGMMECKKALTETGGDIEAADELMRKPGMATAAKKAGRVVAKGALAAKPASVDEVMGLAIGGVTVDEVRRALIAKLGENISVRLFTVLESAGGKVGIYLHGSRIGVLAAVKGGDEALAKDIAMHVAASKPVAVGPQDVSDDVIAKEKEIYVAQAAASGKPAEIDEKKEMGRVRNFLCEITLLGQPFVKNPDQTVEQLLKEKGASTTGFVRYVVGEGIEKKVDNFAEEVMAQVRGG